MSSAAAPTDDRTLTPYFTVAAPDLLIAFLASVFDATVAQIMRRVDGSVEHARLRIGNSLIMINEANADYLANISQVHFYVDDVDARFARALAHHAMPLMAPNERSYGDRLAGLRDPCGNIWWIATCSRR